MTSYKIRNLKILCYCLTIWFIILTALMQFVNSSEFPERECCDLTPTINPIPIPPAALPTEKTLTSTQSTIQTIHVGRSGSNIKVASAILNCILARQLCFEDSSCSAILEIIPRVCGPIPVSCSTVTVTKCQAALRTLQAFQFFRPTCLCKEPGMDPDCNHFRDFLFDHPCGFVLKKAEKDPYPIDALPTCNHALSVCQQERKCIKLFEDFKTHCKVRDNKCKMESRDDCHDSWTNLRLSPMFGCICPNNHMKKRCDRIFNVVNHNPCVGGQDFGVDHSTEIIKQHFQSTCHTALDTCREDPSCLSSLQPILMNCEMHHCNHNACMSALQSFYRGPHEDLNLDVAFCLCKKNPIQQDACIIAQEKLHPVCAQRSTDMQHQSQALLPLCHAVAETCKENRECRIKLEYYEQACAVDSVTKKCAGRQSGCRLAIIGILGTMLRTTCTCQGADMQYLYQCIGWRRLLWMNPCVVEAQKDFHMKRLMEMGFLTTPSTMTTTLAASTISANVPVASNSNTHHVSLPNSSLYTPSSIKDAQKSSNHFYKSSKKPQSTSVEHNYNEQPPYSGSDENGNNGNDDYHNSIKSNKNNNNNNNNNNSANNFTSSLSSNRTTNGHDSKYIYNVGIKVSASTMPSLTTLKTHNGSTFISNKGGINKAIVDNNNNNNNNNKNNNKNNNNVNVNVNMNVNGNGKDIGSVIVDFDDQMIYVEATEFVTIDPTVVITTPTTTTTTTKVKPLRNCVVQRPQQSDQLISESTSKRIYTLDDAECSELCTCGESLTLTCHALCVPFTPCRTALAFYSHASPAYQAFRGRCLCYSGRFICMKPPLGEYTLPGGLFLMLGYSSADEALLRPHTNLGVQDAVRALQQYVTTHINNQTQCTLTLLNMTDENLIIAARLPHDAKLSTIEALRKEKNECITVLKAIAHHINSEHHELQSHRLLSIFKMAEVEIVWPEASQTIQLYNNCIMYIVIMLIILIYPQTQTITIIPVSYGKQQQQQRRQHRLEQKEEFYDKNSNHNTKHKLKERQRQKQKQTRREKCNEQRERIEKQLRQEQHQQQQQQQTQYQVCKQHVGMLAT